MNRFNLTFSGEILPGESLDQVKLRFAEMFEIDDAERLDRFFSGEPIILRRNLERKEAAEQFQELRNVGVVAELVKVTAQQAADAIVTPGVSSSKPDDNSAKPKKTKNAKKRRKKAKPDEVQLDLPLENSSENKSSSKRMTAAEKKRLAAQVAAEKRQAIKLEKAAAKQNMLDAAARDEAQAQLEAEIERKRQETAALEREAARVEAVRAQEARQREQALEAKAKAEKAARAEEIAKAEEMARVEEEAQAEKVKQRLKKAREKLEQANADEEAALATQQIPVKSNISKPKRPAVKSNLDLPRGKLGQQADAQGPIFRQRQAGEPNLYSLEAFRNSPYIRGRAERAKQRAHKGMVLAIASLIGFVIVFALYTQQRGGVPDTYLTAVAIDSKMGPTLLASPWLAKHDRAGVSTGEITLDALGVSSLEPPMLYSALGEIIIGGELKDPSKPTGTPPAANSSPIPTTTIHEQAASDSTLLRCNLDALTCNPLGSSTSAAHIAALAENPIDNSLLLLHSHSKMLQKVTPSGSVVASAPIELPENPKLVLDGGLLLMNSASAPAISVYRYDTHAFGKQLDEILLLPPAAMDRKQSQIYDFARTGDVWWVAMSNPNSKKTNLYRFDAQWNYLGEPDTPPTSIQTLTAWGEKLLVSQEGSLILERFATDGQRETAFNPTSLSTTLAARNDKVAMQQLGWRSALALFALLAAAGAFIAWLQRARALVYGHRRERGAPPIEDVANSMQWIPHAKGRKPTLNRFAAAYAAISVAAVIWSISIAVNAWTLGAILITFAGPAITLALLKRSPPCHVGVNNEFLTLVDHRGIYHTGSGSQIAYRGSCMLLDDVVVHAGSAALPAFDLDTMRSEVKPLVVGGIRVDRKTLIAKLLEAGHPIARGVLISIGCAGLGIALWLTGGV